MGRPNKQWLVSEAVADKALEICARYFDVVDARGKSQDELEEAQIEAEIGQIEANQKAILENQGYIEQLISELSDKISRYSFSSKSAVKGAMARDRALFEHSIRNAQLPIDQLAEMQIRGMQACLRLIDGGYNFPR